MKRVVNFRGLFPAGRQKPDAYGLYDMHGPSRFCGSFGFRISRTFRK